MCPTVFAPNNPPPRLYTAPNVKQCFNINADSETLDVPESDPHIPPGVNLDCTEAVASDADASCCEGYTC